MLKIIIKNAAEVASKQSLLANVATLIAPDFVRNRVDQAIAERLRQSLAESGVIAEVSVEPDPPEAPS